MRPRAASASDAASRATTSGPHAVPERAAAAQQRVAVEHPRECAERELRELVAALARERVQLLDVVQRRNRGEGRRRAAVHERIERERVVRAGREGEGDVHERSISATTRAVTRASSASASSNRQSPRSRSSTSFEIDTQLERRHALVEAGCEHGEPLHRLDRRRAELPPTCALVPIGSASASGQGAPRCGQQLRRGCDRLAVAVAVHRLGADHRGEQRNAAAAARARDADVEHDVRAALRDGVLRRGVGLAQGRCRRPACALPLRRRAHEG